MTKPMLQLDQITISVNGENNQPQNILHQFNLAIDPGDFVTVVGGNGAGKSTLFNTIAGNLQPTSGTVRIDSEDVTLLNEERRSMYIARVFQDPKLGTAPRMTVAENLLLAKNRGSHFGLKIRQLKENRTLFHDLCAQMGNGLEEHLDTATGNLSGGQRQALSLLMATVKLPKILLLDEHTAALDPKTSEQLMSFTNRRIGENKLTCLMITHNLSDALAYGNQLLVLNHGEIQAIYKGAEKAKLTEQDLYQYFMPG